MAPPSSAPKLSKIDPDRLGVDTVRRVLEHVEQQALRLGLRYVIRLPIDAADSDLASADLALTVADLARYAQTGAGRDDEVGDQLADVLAATSSTPTDPGRALEDLGRLDDLVQPLSLVMLAALGRRSIADGVAVQHTSLAALAGLGGRQVWHLIRQGEIEATDDGQVSAEVARRWLGQRRVAGFQVSRP